jgi:hypothetical protein
VHVPSAQWSAVQGSPSSQAVSHDAGARGVAGVAPRIAGTVAGWVLTVVVVPSLVDVLVDVVVVLDG